MGSNRKVREVHATAFSLAELLVVLALIGTLLALAVPAFTSISRASNLRRAGEMIVDSMNLARQQTVANGYPVELRLYQFAAAGEQPAFRGMQLFGKNAGGQCKPLTKFFELPAGVIAETNTTYSSVFEANVLTSVTVSAPIAGRTMTGCRVLTFRPDGSTALPDRSGNYFLTLRQRTADLSNGLENYFCIQIDPVNGRTRIYRP